MARHRPRRGHSLEVLVLVLRGCGGRKDGGLARGGELGHEGAGHGVLDPATCVAQGGKGVGRVPVAGDGGRTPGAKQFTVTSCNAIRWLHFGFNLTQQERKLSLRFLIVMLSI